MYARTPEDNAELGLLTRALPPFGAQGTGGSKVVTRLSALAPLVLQSTRWAGRRRTCGSGRSRRWCWSSTRQAKPAWAVAAAALGLTRMESQVAVLLAQGMSVREIAAATGRRESTIRSL